MLELKPFSPEPKRNRAHVFLCAALVVISLACIILPVGVFVSWLIVLLLNAYVVAFLVEISFSFSHKFKGYYLIQLPSRSVGLLAFYSIFLATIFAYAAVYLYSQSISGGVCKCLISEPLDAIYFSAVTVTTLGYGEFLPTTDAGKLAVIFQLFSGSTILAVGLAVVVTRATDTN